MQLHLVFRVQRRLPAATVIESQALFSYPQLMIIKRAATSLGLISVLYLGVLAWADSTRNVFVQLPVLAGALPLLVGVSLTTYFLRYCRWHWLLRRTAVSIPAGIGFLAYVSGFALTATPGKVGELLRIRYLEPLGVRRKCVVAAFVYERTFDLFAVLLIAAAAAAQFQIFVLAASFVTCMVLLVIVFARNPQWLGLIAAHIRYRGLRRLSRIIRTLRDGVSGTKIWMNLKDISISFSLGFLAWTLTSISFNWLLKQLGVELPFFTAIAVYPLAMLAGAASMLPGGVGSAEAAIVVMLAACDIAIETAALAAIGIRLATLWFAILCGLAASGVLEWRLAVRASVSRL